MGRTRRDDSYEDDEDEDEESDWDAGDDYDPEDPETYPHGLYDDDGPPTVPCPHCRADILEDSEQCPRCGAYNSKEDSPSGSSGPWMLLMVLALIAAALWVVGRG